MRRMLKRLSAKLDSFLRSRAEPERPAVQAAAALPDLQEPKVTNKPVGQASFSKRTKTTTGDTKLSAADRRTANLDMLTMRNGTTTKSTIRDLAAVSPDLSGSVWAYQRMVVTRAFTAVAYQQGGIVDTAANDALQVVLARMNFLTDYSTGFNNISGIHALAESLTKELRIEGSCSLELVLDKARLPSRMQPIATSQIEFYEAKDGTTFPVQKVSGNEINLDVPTFFYESLDQDLLTAYSDSPMEAAIQAALADAEFNQDVRRVIKRALHPRLDVTIDTENFLKQMPASKKGDEKEARQYQDDFIADIEGTVNGLEPDDALVHFDSTKFDYLNNGNVTLDREYETLQNLTNAKMATGTKAPPAVLGHGSGSQNVASSESMLFVKYCEGVQLKVNSILSRALTLALRLLGFDVYVEFAFDRIDLRPESELEAFRTQKQSRVLELLSIGFLSDEQACILLTGRLPPPGAPKLSGTFFKAGATDPAAAAGELNSNTGALNQAQSPDTTTGTRGGNVKRVK